MSLGETIDRIQKDHQIKSHPRRDCETCMYLDDIQKEYEQMIQSLWVAGRIPSTETKTISVESRELPGRKPGLGATLVTLPPIRFVPTRNGDVSVALNTTENAVGDDNDSETYESVLKRDPDYIERFEPDFEKEDAA
jgi:hypothetical protein